MSRVGVLGGTFDPIHLGHIGIASAALEVLALTRLDLVPSFSPPHRPVHRPAAPWHRHAMVVLATTDRPRLFASDREIRRGGVSYMLETLRSYREDEPGSCPILVLGLDAFADLPSWREPRALVEEFDLLVASRPGVEQEGVVRSLPDWVTRRIVPLASLSRWAGGGVEAGVAGRQEGAGGRIAILDAPPHSISATEVRRRAARGESIIDLVPKAVADYILKYNVYEGGYPAPGE